MKRLAAIAAVVLTAVTLIAATPLTTTLAAPVPAVSQSAADHLTLTWTGDPSTTQTITWRTSTTVTSEFVQFAAGAAVADGAQAVAATAKTLSADTGAMTIWSATLTGLTPGTTYAYRVGDGTAWSAIDTFKTENPAAPSFKFLIFGDSQSGDAANPEYGPWKTTLHNAFAANPDASFFVNVGDLVEQGQNYNHWENWFAASAGVIDTIPDMATQGNHETYTPPDGHSTKPVDWMAQFPLPQNGPEGLKNQTYSFDYGNVHFVMLDSQADEENPIAGDILAAQKSWLENDLKNTDKPWKLVFFHKTPYYNKATRTNESIKAAFDPILEKYHADVVFNGHDHSVARTYPMNNDEPTAKPSQGTIYYVTGRSGNKYYPDLSAKVWDAFFYDPQDQPNYVVAEATATTLNVKAVKQDGTVIDSFSIDKTNDTMAPAAAVTPHYTDTRLVVYGNMIQQPAIAASPFQANGKWNVPLRSFMQYLSGLVNWNPDGTIDLTYGKDNVAVKIGGSTAVKNGSSITLPDPVTLSKGTTFVTTEDLYSLFGFSARYDAQSNQLLIAK